MDNAEVKVSLQRAINMTYAQAKLAGACDLFTGEEDTIEEMARLLLSPQGVEFAVKSGCPSVSTFRLFKPFLRDELGVYIDAGCVNLRDPGRVVLVGKTTANITCEALQRNEITLLRGAKASLSAFSWAVVAVNKDPESECISSASGNAVILQ